MTKEELDSLAAKPVYRVVKTSRLYEQIVKQVEDSILKGQLKPGDQLPAERDLAQRFGVSRTAVREAVKTLREKGLVEAYSGRGTFARLRICRLRLFGRCRPFHSGEYSHAPCRRESLCPPWVRSGDEGPAGPA